MTARIALGIIRQGHGHLGLIGHVFCTRLTANASAPGFRFLHVAPPGYCRGAKGARRLHQRRQGVPIITILLLESYSYSRFISKEACQFTAPPFSRDGSPLQVERPSGTIQ